jgi:hypothetical protein
MWAIVEVMGHRVRAGLVGDAQLGGQTLLRVEHPTEQLDGDPLAEYYSAAAIFGIRPCTEEHARAVAAYHWQAGPQQRELPPTFEQLVQDDDEWDDDEPPYNPGAGIT